VGLDLAALGTEVDESRWWQCTDIGGNAIP
jgi:hypothetical protein